MSNTHICIIHCKELDAISFKIADDPEEALEEAQAENPSYTLSLASVLRVPRKMAPAILEETKASLAHTRLQWAA